MALDLPMGTFFALYFAFVLAAMGLAWLLGPRRTDREDPIVRNAQRLSLAVTLGFMGIFGGLVYWQILRADALLQRADNPRILAAELRQRRGRILDRQGRPLVVSRVGRDDIVQRVYEHPPLVHVTGFVTPRLGPTGLERSGNQALVGQTVGNDLQRVIDGVLHRPRIGDDVVTTIDLEIQRVAEQALGPATGAVVLLDPRTGEVLALVSRPWFDPNELTYDPARGSFDAEARRSQQAWDRLRVDPDAPLVNRATQGQYAPGSTFKTVTLAIALDLGLVRPDQQFRFDLRSPDREHRVAWHANRFVSCQNHPHLSELSLAQAYAWSCNVVFSALALEIGPDRFRTVAQRFGFDLDVPFELPLALSQLATERNYFAGAEGVYGLAATGMGQGKLAVTPLQMALVAAAVAFNGVIQRPRLIRAVLDPNGSPVKRVEPRGLGVALTARTADLVRAMMVQAVDQGWAARARIPGVQVGGKTGTAELGVDDQPHSWFIGLAPAEAPRFAIAVVKENAGFGSEQAAPIAQRVLRAALAANPG